jgi:exodeoxyribonuclease VII small subunit
MTEETRTYEENLTILKEAVEKLERGDLTFDEMEKLTEDSQQAYQACKSRIDKFQQRLKAVSSS